MPFLDDYAMEAKRRAMLAMQGQMPQAPPMEFAPPPMQGLVDRGNDDLSMSELPPQPSFQSDPAERMGLALAGQNTAQGIPLQAEDQRRASSVRSLIEPGPMQQKYLADLSGGPAPAHGIGGHLMGALKGLAMGNIGGAILGAIDPNMVNRAWYRTQAQAGAGPAQEEARQQADKRRGATEVGALTGIDPTTGLRTPGADYKDYMAQIAAGNLANRQRGTESLIDRRSAATANQDKTARTNQLRGQLAILQASGAVPSPQDMETLRTQYPDFVFPQGFDPTKYKMDVDASGNLITMPISGARAGEAKSVTQDGQPVGSFKGTQLKSQQAEGAANRGVRVSEGEKTRQAQAQRQAQSEAHSTAQKTVDSAKKTLDAAAAAVNKAEGMFGATDAQRAAVATAQAAYDAARASLAKAAPPQATAPSAVAPPLTRTNIKEDGIFTYKGRTVRIKNFDPATGNFTPVPVQ